MDAKNQQDRAKMVEEAVGRMCRLGMMPQVITKFRKQGTVLKSETAGILYDLNDEEKKAVADWEEESGGIVYAAILSNMVFGKKIISQMAVVDVCEEEKPVEVGKTIMTSREVADMFQEYHSVTYRRIAQLIVELEPMEQTEFKMAQFKARHQEYPMWELTEKACKLYLTRMKRDRCYGKKKTGIEKMEKELRCRVSGQKLVEDAENGYKDVRELFNQFITGPKGENREIPELTQAYERLRAVMEAQVPGAKADTAITSAVYDVAIESEMQGFIYGFQLFGAVLQGCGSTRRCAGEN